MKGNEATNLIRKKFNKKFREAVDIMKNKRKINNILCKITVIVLLAASVILPYSINFTRAQAATEIVAAESSESTSSDIVKTRKGVIADWFYFPFEQTAENASIIIYGKVVERGETKINELCNSRGEVVAEEYYTEITVKVLKNIKGALGKGTIIYKEPGGEPEDVICVYDGLNPVEVGGEYIFFLNEYYAFLNPLTVVSVSEGTISLKSFMIPEAWKENEEFQAAAKVTVEEYIKAIKAELNYDVKCIEAALAIFGGAIVTGLCVVWVKKHRRFSGKG